MAKAFDIGRHNALDRVAGQALLRGIDLGQAYVLSSGRISSEMVRKCLVAGIPLIASRGATTTLAVSLAEKNGLTVIGFVRAGGMNIYTNPHRVTRG
jgi:FdhD protein